MSAPAAETFQIAVGHAKPTGLNRPRLATGIR
jgi:hypothetical protein